MLVSNCFATRIPQFRAPNAEMKNCVRKQFYGIPPSIHIQVGRNLFMPKLLQLRWKFTPCVLILNAVCPAYLFSHPPHLGFRRGSFTMR